MQLLFVYAPVPDLEQAVPFYRDVLGLAESWREGADTVAFDLPGQQAQLMVSVDDRPGGPMYLVEDVAAWLADRPAAEVVVPAYAIPGGQVAGVRDPAGNVLYVFDQSLSGAAEAEDDTGG